MQQPKGNSIPSQVNLNPTLNKTQNQSMQEMKRSEDGTIKQQVSGNLKSAMNLPSSQLDGKLEETKTEMARVPSGMSRQDIKLNNNSAISGQDLKEAPSKATLSNDASK
jgi:hypothetical protein